MNMMVRPCHKDRDAARRRKVCPFNALRESVWSRLVEIFQAPNVIHADGPTNVPNDLKFAIHDVECSAQNCRWSRTKKGNRHGGFTVAEVSCQRYRKENSRTKGKNSPGLCRD